MVLRRSKVIFENVQVTKTNIIGYENKYNIIRTNSKISLQVFFQQAGKSELPPKYRTLSQDSKIIIILLPKTEEEMKKQTRRSFSRQFKVNEGKFIVK